MKQIDTSAPARAPRTFEMRDEQWVETGRPQRPRGALWLIVPAALAAMTAAFFVLFAVLAALMTGGLLAARRRFLDASASFRQRFSAILRR